MAILLFPIHSPHHLIPSHRQGSLTRAVASFLPAGTRGCVVQRPCPPPSSYTSALHPHHHGQRRRAPHGAQVGVASSSATSKNTRRSLPTPSKVYIQATGERSTEMVTDKGDIYITSNRD